MFYPSYNVQNEDKPSRRRSPVAMAIAAALLFLGGSVLWERHAVSRRAEALEEAAGWNRFAIALAGVTAQAERLDASFDRTAVALENLRIRLEIEEAAR